MSEKLRKFGPYLIFLAAMLWATDAPFRVQLTQDLPSIFIVLVEHGISLLVLIPFFALTIQELKRLSWKKWLAIIFIGVGGSALALVAFTQSFSYMNPSVVILLQKLQPIIAITLAVSLLKEKIGKWFWIGTALALVGAYMISFPNLIPKLFEGEIFNPHIIGVLLALVATILWGASTVLGKYVLNTISFKAMTTVRFIVAFIFLACWNLVQGSFSLVAHLSSKDWLFLGIIALASGAIAMFIYYKGLSHAKASVATIAELGFPLAAVVVNYFFLDATLSIVQMIGMIILLYAVFQLGKSNVPLES